MAENPDSSGSSSIWKDLFTFASDTTVSLKNGNVSVGSKSVRTASAEARKEEAIARQKEADAQNPSSLTKYIPPVLGGLAGFFFAGPFGALVGAGAGYALSSSTTEE